MQQNNSRYNIHEGVRIVSHDLNFPQNYNSLVIHLASNVTQRRICDYNILLL